MNTSLHDPATGSPSTGSTVTGGPSTGSTVTGSPATGSAAGNSATGDPSTSALATVRAYFDARSTDDLDSTLALLDPDVHWYVPGDPDLVPWAGTRTGHAALREWFGVLGDAGEVLAFELYALAAQADPEPGAGEYVFANGRFAFRFPSGNEYHDEFVMRFTVRAGRISAYRMYEDSLALARAYA